MGRNPLLPPQYLVLTTSVTTNESGQKNIGFDLFGPYYTPGEALLEKKALSSEAFSKESDSVMIYCTSRPPKKLEGEITQIMPAFAEENLAGKLSKDHVHIMKKMHRNEMRKRKRLDLADVQSQSRENDEKNFKQDAKKKLKAPRKPTLYNIFLQREIREAKEMQKKTIAEHPDFVLKSHKEIFKYAANKWASHPDNPKCLTQKNADRYKNQLVEASVSEEGSSAESQEEVKNVLASNKVNIEDLNFLLE